MQPEMMRTTGSRKWRYVLPMALSMMSLAFATPAAWAQEQMMRTLTVSGRGVESIPTTLSQVRLGVEVQGRTAEDVQRQAAERSAAVVNLLRSRNVQKLQTTGISLNPVYSYENNTQRITGYAASNIVSFEIPTDQAGTLLDDAVGAGATRIDGVSFVASDAAIATARQQALREATADAQEQASAVLSTLNLSAQEVVSIQINSASPPPMPIFFREAAVAQADSAAPTPVVGGEQQVEASVTLQIRY